MELSRPHVVFFGSGPVAAKSLELLTKNFIVEAVVTKPKPAHHRGSFPVLDVVERLKLPVHTVSNKAELSALIKTAPFTSNAAVLIDFGIIVAQGTIDYFPKGIVNSHFSLLPELRGADPITFAILSGQKQTGVSLMLLVEAMDEGPLLGFGIYEMPENITASKLTDDLIYLSDALLRDMLPSYISEVPMAGGDLPVHPRSQEWICENMQRPFKPTYSRKLTKADGQIDWTKPAEQIEREIRAFSEWPKSYTNLASIDVIITSAEVIDNSGHPGEHKIIDKQLIVFCGDKALKILKIKPAGKKEITGLEFISGYLKQV